MKERVLVYPLLALALSSCSSSDNEQDYAEVYLSDGCISIEPGSSSPDTYITIPQALLEVLKPEQENGTSEVYKDTLDLKTTITDYRLMIRNQSAELTINTQAKMKAREIRRTANYYVFKAGRYEVNGTAVEVRDDGIYLEDGRNILELKNYRFVESSENEVVSSSDFTKRYTTIARGEASGNPFTVSQADTTYKCSRLSDKEIRLDMLTPEQWECTTLDKQ